MIKAILFDLDGTLLPMNQDSFVKAYMYSLSKKASLFGYEPQKLINTVWKGTESMVKNKGNISNEELFWEVFASEYGINALNDKHIFDEFYFNEFENIRNSCGYNENAKKVIEIVKNKGFKLILATNPIFPKIATEARIRWAGLSSSDFELVTTYENSYHCKPNLDYYKDILEEINCLPEECIMIGNDVNEDMVAKNLGMNTFLLTDNLINTNGKDINEYINGGYIELINYLTKL